MMSRGDRLNENSGNNRQLTKLDEKIIKIVKDASRPISKREIAKRLKLSPATTGKYVDILVAKYKLNIELYGNIHLISMGGQDHA